MDNRKRIPLLDALRGLCVIIMVLYHTCYDLYVFGYLPEELVFCTFVTGFGAPVLASVFILISGICCRFSRSNTRRGLIALVAALVVTAASAVVGQTIVFGVLHFFACAMIFYGLTGKWLDKIPRKAALVIWSVLFAVTAVAFLNRSYEISGLWWLGIHNAAFASADYYPIMPWIFMFLLGTVLGAYVTEGRFPRRFYSLKCSPLESVGRHAMIIYLLHQPVCFGLCWLFSRIVG